MTIKYKSATQSVEGVIEVATNAEVALFTDESRAITSEGLGYAMAGNIAYGVDWDEDDSSPILTRTGALAGIAAASSPGNICLPIQAAMRRCILNDDGTVNYYLSATDSTKKEDGTTASDLTGTDGQVMVEIPRFAYKYSYVAATNVHSWSISSVLLPGYEWHPAFYKDGAWVDNRYIGAYEGSMWDDGTSAMVPDANIEDAYVVGAGDKLCSITGQYPKTNETRDDYRTLALQRGVGWRQQDFYLCSAIQLLYLVEYASFYSQSVIGMGRTNFTGGAWEAANQGNGMYIGQCGYSNSDGNVTNATDRTVQLNIAAIDTSQASYQDYMSYRGIENFFGNVWKWVDGFNINNNIPYVSNVETDFADGTDSNYTRLTDTGGSGITLAAANDYQKTLEQTKGGFLPSAGGGSSSTYITDYYYQDAAWRVSRLGGAAHDGDYAGFFYWLLDALSSYDCVGVGGRVCF